MKTNRFLTMAAALGVISMIAFAGVLPANASVNRAPATTRHLVHPRTTGVVTHTYTVTTTSDDTLWISAPAHTCQDTTDHGKCSFRAAVAAANADHAEGVWDVIKVPAGDYKLNSSVSASSPYFSEEYTDVTIEGAGAGKTIIDGAALGFDNELLVLDNYYESVQLDGLTFKGGYSDEGGAVYEWEYSSVTTSDCSFVDNHATEYGGAIYAESEDLVDVTSTSFSGNTATYYGGAIDDDANEELNLSNDSFTDNSVTDTSTDYIGGAIYADGNVAADHTTFSNNTAYGAGGAIYGDGNGVYVDDTFNGNHSTEGEGGAIYADDDVTVTGSKLTGNTAGVEGGAVYNNESGVYDSDTFEGNSTQGYGSDLYDDDNATVTNSSFSKGRAEVDGGSIYVNDGYALSMSDDTITDSTALGTAEQNGGGAIYLEESLASLDHVTIKGTTAPDSGGSGGGIFCTECELNFDNSSLTDSAASYAGGGIYSYNDGDVTVDNSTISGNTAEWGGGINVDDSSSLLVNDSTLDANKSTYFWGGGISIEYESYGQVTNSTLADNKAVGVEGYGGAASVYADGEAATGDFDNDTFAGNTAEYGGALYGNDSYITNNYNTVAFNSAPDGGGGMYNNDTFWFTTGSIWADNTGGDCAGDDFYASGGSNLDSDNSCALNGPGDLINRSEPDLGVLANNGGPTQTISPLSDSPAMGNGGGACPTSDQRGVSVPTGQPCDIGAVFVEKTSTSLTLAKTKITKGHEQAEVFSIEVTPAVKGEKPVGSASIMHGTTDVCTATLSPVPGSKAVAYRGSCTLSPAQLKAGTYSVVALYNTSGVLGSSESSAKTVKVSG